MIRLPPRSTRTDTRFPDTTIFRSAGFFLAAALVGLVGWALPGPWQSTIVPGLVAFFPLWIGAAGTARSEEHTSELQSLMSISYAVFCLKKQKKKTNITHTIENQTR